MQPTIAKAAALVIGTTNRRRRAPRIASRRAQDGLGGEGRRQPAQPVGVVGQLEHARDRREAEHEAEPQPGPPGHDAARLRCEGVVGVGRG